MNNISPAEALAMLKKWQQAEQTLLLPIANFSARASFSKVRVRIVFVDESTMLLAMLEDPWQSESRPLAGAVFTTSDGADLNIKFSNGWEWHLYEME